MLAMVGFTLLIVGLLGLHSSLQDTAVERLTFWALAIGLIGVGLTLPFYGGGAFGLHAIGQEAVRQHTVALVSLANVVRTGPQLVMFLVGLLLNGAVFRSPSDGTSHSAVLRNAGNPRGSWSAGYCWVSVDRRRLVAAE